MTTNARCSDPLQCHPGSVWRRAGLLCAAAAMAVGASLTASVALADALAGSAQVVSGDHIIVNGTHVRLAGIDAPEADQTCRLAGRTYDCGKIAGSALMDLTAGQTVACTTEIEPDHDGTIIADCSAEGFSLSRNMVYTGWALAADERYVDVQDDAQQQRRGLWRGEFVFPWDWRAGERLP